MKIANIIYDKELVNHTKVEYVNYYNQQVKYDDLDKSLPTLFVGWSFMKSCNPENEMILHADILKKKIITNELYWEFSFEEHKASHVKGIETFVGLAPQFYFQPKYQYVNLDPVFFQIAEIEDILAILPKEIDAVYNFKNEMLYVLSGNKIYGINLKMYEFFKFNVTEIINSINNRSIRVITDSDGQMYFNQYKIFPNFQLLKRYMVVILTK